MREARCATFTSYVEPTPHEHVEKAATAAGPKTASWLRHMVRQISITDFPAS
jgi:hypothetical protein